MAATFDRLLSSGYDSVTFEAIARGAGVGKTTIYRWWRNRAHLAIEAFFDATKESIDFPDTGSIVEDFRIQVHRLGELLRQKEGMVLINIIMGAKYDADLRAELFKTWIKPRKIWGEERMKQLEPVDIGVALNTLYGPLYATILFGLPPLSAEEIDIHLDICFKGLKK